MPVNIGRNRTQAFAFFTMVSPFLFQQAHDYGTTRGAWLFRFCLVQHRLIDRYSEPKLQQYYNQNKTPLGNSESEKNSHEAAFCAGRLGSRFSDEIRSSASREACQQKKLHSKSCCLSEERSLDQSAGGAAALTIGGLTSPRSTQQPWRQRPSQFR
jgi:hypothetical protein